MKKLLLLVALAFGLQVNASHLLGGMVTVAQTSYDSTSVAVYLVADQQGISPNTIYVQQWEMDSQGAYVLKGNVSLDKSSTIVHQGTNVYTYVSDYLDLDSNHYRFVYTNCCWGMLNNSSNSFSSDFVISADYYHVLNNSLPYAENPLWVNLQLYTVNTMKPVWGNVNCFLSQLDLDSVSIMQDSLWSGYSGGVFNVQNHTPLNMWVSNDSISWEPHSVGQYGTGFRIEDWRNGQLIGVQRVQWVFRVVTSTVDIKELNLPVTYKIYDWNGYFIGDNFKNIKPNRLYIVRYSNGKIEKIIRCN